MQNDRKGVFGNEGNWQSMVRYQFIQQNGVLQQLTMRVHQPQLAFDPPSIFCIDADKTQANVYQLELNQCGL